MHLSFQPPPLQVSIKHHRRYPLPQRPRYGLSGTLRKWHSPRAVGNACPSMHQQKGPRSQAGMSVVQKGSSALQLDTVSAKCFSSCPVRLHSLVLNHRKLIYVSCQSVVKIPSVMFRWPVSIPYPHVKHFLSADLWLQECLPDRQCWRKGWFGLNMLNLVLRGLVGWL